MKPIIKPIVDRYNAPTPRYWEIIGDRITDLGATLQLVLGGFQVSGHEIKGYVWWVMGVAGLAWLGRSITKLATEEKEKAPEEPLA